MGGGGGENPEEDLIIHKHLTFITHRNRSYASFSSNPPGSSRHTCTRAMNDSEMSFILLKTQKSSDYPRGSLFIPLSDLHQ